MKEKNIYFFGVLLIAVCFLFADNASAQTVVNLSGTQKLVPGANSILKSESKVISAPMTIFEISGNHDGFWIELDGNVYIDFYYVDKVLTPNPIGLILPVGSYRVYPNVQKDPKKPHYTNLDANVKLKLR